MTLCWYVIQFVKMLLSLTIYGNKYSVDYFRSFIGSDFIIFWAKPWRILLYKFVIHFKWFSFKYHAYIESSIEPITIVFPKLNFFFHFFSFSFCFNYATEWTDDIVMCIESLYIIACGQVILAIKTEWLHDFAGGTTALCGKNNYL